MLKDHMIQRNKVIKSKRRGDNWKGSFASPTTATYNTLIEAYGKRKEFEKATDILEELKGAAGTEPNL